MSTYHKIDSIYFRDPDTNHKTFITGRWSRDAFGYLARSEWEWTEKVDGTNIRVILHGGTVAFGGRTDNAQLPAPLVTRLMGLFPQGTAIRDYSGAPVYDAPVVLYGEGYGNKIQSGGKYKSDGVDFVLFDVSINRRFLSRHDVELIAMQLDVSVVPIVGRGTLLDAIQYVHEGFNSAWGDFIAEGLVCRPAIELCDSHGRRIITKIKHKDFLA